MASHFLNVPQPGYFKRWSKHSALFILHNPIPYAVFGAALWSLSWVLNQELLKFDLVTFIPVFALTQFLGPVICIAFAYGLLVVDRRDTKITKAQWLRGLRLAMAVLAVSFIATTLVVGARQWSKWVGIIASQELPKELGHYTLVLIDSVVSSCAGIFIYNVGIFAFVRINTDILETFKGLVLVLREMKAIFTLFHFGLSWFLFYGPQMVIEKLGLSGGLTSAINLVVFYFLMTYYYAAYLEIFEGQMGYQKRVRTAKSVSVNLNHAHSHRVRT